MSTSLFISISNVLIHIKWRAMNIFGVNTIVGIDCVRISVEELSLVSLLHAAVMMTIAQFLRILQMTRSYKQRPTTITTCNRDPLLGTVICTTQ